MGFLPVVLSKIPSLGVKNPLEDPSTVDFFLRKSLVESYMQIMGCVLAIALVLGNALPSSSLARPTACVLLCAFSGIQTSEAVGLVPCKLLCHAAVRLAFHVGGRELIYKAAEQHGIPRATGVSLRGILQQTAAAPRRDVAFGFVAVMMGVVWVTYAVRVATWRH